MVFERIKDFHPLSLCDWPGHPCPVVFLGGCNLACGTCHNGNLAWSDREIESIEFVDLLNMINERKKWYGGVTITGGEPTIHKDLPEFLGMIKDQVVTEAGPIKIKVDSNGTNPAMIRQSLESGVADVFAVDIKGPWHLYPTLTNHTFSAAAAEEKIGEILAMSQEFPGRIYFRCTKVPVLTENTSFLKMVEDVVPAGVAFRFQEFVDPKSSHKSTNTGVTTMDQPAKKMEYAHA